MQSLLTDPDASHVDARAAWRFVRWCLGSIAVLLMAVAGFNAWVDTTGTLGTGLVDPMAQLPRDRAAKADVVERAGSPTLVVLGSSRTKRIDPRDIDPGAERAVNAAAVASDMLEQRVFTRWFAQRAEGGDRPFPHLVVGVDVEQWRGSSLRESGLLAVPQLEAIARREASGGTSLWSIVGQLDDLVLTWSATRASIDALRGREVEESEAAKAALAEGEVTRTRTEDEFDRFGILRSDERWETPRGRAYLARGLAAAIDETIADYRGRYAGYRSRVAPDAVRDFRAMVAIANANGDTPSMYLTPIHPRMAAAMVEEGRPERYRQVLATMERTAREGKITFTDCTRCIPADAKYWVDGVHLSPLGARRLVQVLEGRIELATP